MKKLFLLLLVACVMPAAAQGVLDTNDIFFKHLELKEVIITGTVGDMKMKESPMPIAVLKAKEIREIPSTNIIDAIASQPGVSQITTGGGISKPVIRGLSYNRIVVINDDVRQEGQQWGDEHGIEIDGNEIGSVEIIKGPASLMYGSDAMGGVLVFHGLPTAPDGTFIKGSFNAEYQTNNGLVGGSLNLGGNKKGFNWNAHYTEKHAHSYKNSHDGYVPNSQFNERALSFRAGLIKKWGFTNIKLGYYNINPSIVTGPNDSINPETYSHGLPYQRVHHYKAVSKTFINLPSGNLKIVLGYQQNQRKEYEESPDEYGLFLKLHTLNYDVRYVREFDNDWKFSTGVNGMGQMSRNLGEERLIPDYSLFDAGIFATASKAMGRWNLSGGVRFDHRHLESQSFVEEGVERFKDFKRYFNGVTGSVGATFEVTERFGLKMNLSRGFRTPNISELASNGVHEGSQQYEIGNSDFNPEYSLQGDFGFDFATRHIEIQASLFVNHIQDYIYLHRIDSIIVPGIMTYAYAQGNAMLWGLEAGIDFHPIHALHLGSTFSYVNAQLLNQPEEMKYLPLTPAPRLSFDVKYELTHDGTVFNNAFVMAKLDWYMRQDNYFAAYGTETPTPSYALFGVSVGSDLLYRGRKIAELHLIADNLFDVAYQDHLNRLKYLGLYNMGRNIVFKLVVPI